MSVQLTYDDAPPVGFAGLPIRNCEFLPAWNREASASIPFGLAVSFKPSGAISDYDVTLPAATTDTIMGIVAIEHDFARAFVAGDGATVGDLDATGVKVGSQLSVATEGEIWAICEDGCVPTSRLWIRYTAAGGGYGTLRASDAGGSTSYDATKQGRWLSTAAAGGLARLAFDFTIKA